MRVKFAAAADEWEEAFQLVTDNYRARGYELPGTGKVRFTPYHALPGTAVLVAVTGGRVAATFSIVADNRVLGLPIEHLYADEIRVLRLEGRRIFETISLADRDLSPREFIRVFLTMVHLAWQYGGTETNVITLNPRHRDFYVKVLGYAPLGSCRACARVQGHPAEAFYLDPALMLARAPAMHQQIFGRRLPRQALIAPRMPADLLRSMAARSSQLGSDLAQSFADDSKEMGVRAGRKRSF
jgi:hypothetical protein